MHRVSEPCWTHTVLGDPCVIPRTLWQCREHSCGLENRLPDPISVSCVILWTLWTFFLGSGFLISYMGTRVSSLQECCKDEIKGRIRRIDAQSSDQMVASRKMSVRLTLELEKVTLCAERHPWDGGQRHVGMMQI